MQIVIDVNDGIYEEILSGKDGWSNYVHGLIRTGTPLPKGHGRLIDKDELEPDTEWDYYEDDFISYSRSQIECADTIIEADTESEEDD